MKPWFRLIIFGLVLWLSLLLSACIGPNPQPQTSLPKVPQHVMLPASDRADPNGTLVMALSGDPTFFNPILYTDVESGTVADLIFNGLVRVNEKLQFVPDLAASWEVLDQGKTWIFHLRKGVRFHDGIELTADDVVFTFSKILDPKTNTVRRSDYLINGRPVRFIAVDKYTVKAELPESFSPFLSNMTMGIVPKHLLEKEDINTSDFNRKPIGTGPFKFVEYKPSDHVDLVRNDNYFVHSPKLARIYFRIISDANVQLIALRRGEIDEAGIPPKDYASMIRENKVNVFMYDRLGYSYLGFNNRRPPFDDQTVRQAMAYAVDKDIIIKTVLKGLATNAYSPAHPVSWAFNANVEKFPYNPDKAKTLLLTAGYVLRNGILVKDGQPFKFTVLLTKGNPSGEKAAAIIQQQLKTIGVQMEIRLMEWSSLLKIVNSTQKPKQYDAIMMGWGLGVDPDAYSIWHSGEYPAGFNHNGYANRDVDDLLIEGRREMDQQKRKAIYANVYARIAHDQPYLFLWYPRSIVGVSRRVGGLCEPGPAGLFVNIENVFVTR